MKSNCWAGRRVLVTGGAGFIGSHLTRRLLSLGARVRVADNLARGGNEGFFPDGAVEFSQVDLTDRSACFAVSAGMDAIFHLASRVGAISYYKSKPFEVLSTNIMIDGNVIAAAHTLPVPRLIYASSVFVYPAEKQATPNSPRLQEGDAHPADPPVSYGWAKVVAEKLIEYTVLEDGHCRSAILRLMGVYGPGQDIDLERGSIIPVLIRRALEYPKVPFTIRGDGTETRSYCFVDDVVDAMLCAAEKLTDHALVGPLNIGSEGRIRIVDLAREIIAISRKHIEVQFVPGPTAVWGQAIDCSAARSLLDGWEPRVSLHEGLSHTFEEISTRLGVRAGAMNPSGGVKA